MAATLCIGLSPSPAIANPPDLNDPSYMELDSQKKHHEAMHALAGVAMEQQPLVAVIHSPLGNIWQVDFFRMEDSVGSAVGGATITKESVPVAQGVFIEETLIRMPGPGTVWAPQDAQSTSQRIRPVLSVGTVISNSGEWSVWALSPEIFVPQNGQVSESVSESRLLGIAGVFGNINEPETELKRMSSVSSNGVIGWFIEQVWETIAGSPPSVCSTVPAFGPQDFQRPLFPDIQACYAKADEAGARGRANAKCAVKNCLTGAAIGLADKFASCAPLIVFPKAYVICVGGFSLWNVWDLANCLLKAKELEDQANADRLAWRKICEVYFP